MLCLMFILRSIVYKPVRQDCDCSVEMTFYYKGKAVKKQVSKKGFWQTCSNPDNFSWLRKKLKCDSISINPIQENVIKFYDEDW